MFKTYDCLLRTSVEDRSSRVRNGLQDRHQGAIRDTYHPHWTIIAPIYSFDAIQPASEIHHCPNQHRTEMIPIHGIAPFPPIEPEKTGVEVIFVY